MVKIGMPVKILRPYKNGEKREQAIRTKSAKVVGIYKHFILVEYKAGYKECFKDYEIFYESENSENEYKDKD